MVRNIKLKELLAEIKSGFEAIYNSRLRGLYLFGSYTRGEQDEESDVDHYCPVVLFSIIYNRLKNNELH